MDKKSLDQLKAILRRMHDGKIPPPRCLAIGPRPEEEIPNLNVYFYTCKASECALPQGDVRRPDSVCSVVYEYMGFDERQVSLQAYSEMRRARYASSGDKEWRLQGVWLLPPNPSLGEKEFIKQLTESVYPADDVGDVVDSFLCSTVVPRDAGEAEIRLSIEVRLRTG